MIPLSSLSLRARHYIPEPIILLLTLNTHIDALLDFSPISYCFVCRLLLVRVSRDYSILEEAFDFSEAVT